jgi:hypothetical protein
MIVDEVKFTVDEMFGEPDDDWDHGWNATVHTPYDDYYLGGIDDLDIDVAFHTADAAIDAIRVWCSQRGFEFGPVEFKITAHRGRDALAYNKS